MCLSECALLYCLSRWHSAVATTGLLICSFIYLFIYIVGIMD